MIVESLPAADLVIAEMQQRGCIRQESAKTFFPRRNRHRGDRFAIEVEKIKQEKTRAPLLPLSEAFWIKLNEVVPSGRMPHSSPSR
jgi:hypothetical protein